MNPHVGLSLFQVSLPMLLSKNLFCSILSDFYIFFAYIKIHYDFAMTGILCLDSKGRFDENSVYSLLLETQTYEGLLCQNWKFVVCNPVSKSEKRLGPELYRVLIKYCVFLKMLKYIPDSGIYRFTLDVSECIHNGRSNTSAAAELAEFRKITTFLGKTQYFLLRDINPFYGCTVELHL